MTINILLLWVVITRMHSSRMRTARSLTIGGCTCLGGVPAQESTCLGGCTCQGGTCPGTPPCGQNSWHTLLKILPCPNFVAGSNYCLISSVWSHWLGCMPLLPIIVDKPQDLLFISWSFREMSVNFNLISKWQSLPLKCHVIACHSSNACIYHADEYIKSWRLTGLEI